MRLRYPRPPQRPKRPPPTTATRPSGWTITGKVIVWLLAAAPGVLALWVSHVTLARSEVAQVTQLLLPPMQEYEDCVQRVEGKGRDAFVAGRHLQEGCYGAAHSLWNALAGAAEIAGLPADDRRHLPEAYDREPCPAYSPLEECAARLAAGMHVCRANVRFDSLDAEAEVLGLHKAPFSKTAFDDWLAGLRHERDQCIAFVRSIEQAIKAELRKTSLRKYRP